MIKLNNFNYKIESTLILFIPVALIFSRLFLELFLLYIAISFVIISLKEKDFSFFKNKLSYLFFVLFSIILTSYLFSEHKKETFTALFYFRFYFYILALSFFFTKEKNLVNNFLKIIIYLILVLFIDSCIQYFTGQNILGYKNSEVHRISSFFNDEQIMGSYVVKIFVFLLLAKFIINEKLKLTNFLLDIAIIVSPLLIFLSGERSSLLIFGLMFLYYFIFFFREKKFSYFYPVSILGIFLLSLFLLNSKVYYDRYITQTLNSIFDKNYSQNRDLMPNDLKNNFNFYFLSGQHQNYLITSWNIFKQNKILGSGPKSFRYVCSNKNYKINYYSCGTHQHNYYIQFLSDLGLMGIFFLILIYFFIILKSFSNLYKLIKKEDYSIVQIIILGYYFSQLWPLNQTGNFFNNYNSILFFLPLSLYMSSVFKENK